MILEKSTEVHPMLTRSNQLNISGLATASIQSQVDNATYRFKGDIKVLSLSTINQLFKKWDVLWETTQKQAIQTSLLTKTLIMVEMDLHNGNFL